MGVSRVGVSRHGREISPEGNQPRRGRGRLTSRTLKASGCFPPWAGNQPRAWAETFIINRKVHRHGRWAAPGGVYASLCSLPGYMYTGGGMGGCSPPSRGYGGGTPPRGGSGGSPPGVSRVAPRLVLLVFAPFSAVFGWKRAENG